MDETLVHNKSIVKAEPIVENLRVRTETCWKHHYSKNGLRTKTKKRITWLNLKKFLDGVKQDSKDYNEKNWNMF